MVINSVQFTLIDRIVIESYRSVMDGLAEFLGPAYEIVLHSLENFEQSVIYIINGEHTGRKVGDPISDKSLELIDFFESGEKNSIGYFSKNIKGELLKATTMAIRGERGRIIGLLCVNLYMNTPFADMLSTFSPPVNSSHLVHSEENYIEGVDDLIELSLHPIMEKVHADPSIASVNKNKEIIRLLYEKRFFEIKGSVMKVANIIGLSKNTVYMHLRSLQENTSKIEN
ncbi:MAG: transcriptional regulator [Clostridiaceae bacterium]